MCSPHWAHAAGASSAPYPRVPCAALLQSCCSLSGGTPDSLVYSRHCSPSRSSSWLASSGEKDTRETTIPCWPCGPMRRKSSVNSCGVRAIEAAFAHLPANSSGGITMFGPCCSGCSESSEGSCWSTSLSVARWERHNRGLPRVMHTYPVTGLHEGPSGFSSATLYHCGTMRKDEKNRQTEQ